MVIARQGGEHVLFGSALALAAAVQAWSVSSAVQVSDLIVEIIR